MNFHAWGWRLGALLAVAILVPACGKKHRSGGAAAGPGITVTLTSAASTTEGGGQATFTVVLNTLPTATVTIAVGTSDGTEGTPDTALLTFTTVDGTTPQIVTVTGADDALLDGNIPYSITLGAAASADASYAGLDPADVALTNIDNEVVGISVTPTTLTDMTEGQTRTFVVALQVAPLAGDVVVPVSVTTGVGQVEVSSVPAPQSQAQGNAITLTLNAGTMSATVTVHGLDDGTPEATLAYVVTTGDPTAAGDPLYDALIGTDVADVTGNLLDNDLISIIVTPTTAAIGPTLLTNEAGGQDSFRVRLGSAIAGTVTVTLSGVDANEGSTSPAIPLVFTSADAQTFQTVTLTGLDDPIAPDAVDVAYTITLTAADTGAVDPGYAGLTASVFVVNVDLDSYTGTTPPGVSPPFSAPTAAPGIPLGGVGAFDAFEADHPAVINNGLSGLTYEMWYRGRTQSGIKNDAIGRSTSNAAASGWSTGAQVLAGDGLPGSWTRRGVGRPSVAVGNFDLDLPVPTPNSYLMFLSGRFAGTYDGIDVVGSADGVTWNNPSLPGAPVFTATGAAGDWDESDVSDPCVIFDAGGSQFRMWYAGTNAGGIFQIGYASAPLAGGVPGTWVRGNVGATPAVAAGAANSFSAGGVSAPTVVYDATAGLYRMWFTAHDLVRGRTTLGYAESALPATGWIVFPTPVLQPDTTGVATWADQNVFAPTVLLTDAAGTGAGTGVSTDVFRIWYSGTGTGGAGIGYVGVSIP